jgi:putative pyruvate formate lyase activating enzyme
VVLAIVAARSKGLNLPIVYNVSGYESAETVRMLEGIVEVYLVDMRYSSSTWASEYSQAPDYPHHNKLAVKEMLRQVGPLSCQGGLAVHGVIIRHLLLPGLLSETYAILRFISRRLSTAIPVSLMSQYFPAHRAHLVRALSRKITGEEYSRAIALLERCQLRTGWVQDSDSASIPVA